MKKNRKQYGSKRNLIHRRKRNQNQSNNPTTNTSAATHARDVNSRRIFKNSELTCQFLKDYSGISYFSDIKPEDIEDVTAKYQVYLGIEFETDVVKKVRVKVDNEVQEIFVLPLIEHKSYVDYDVQMQILRYMTVIWYEYGKEQNKKAGHSVTKNKSFRYPLIIPFVYYEGKAAWTADLNLWNRVELGEEMREYIPDFTYNVIRIHDYTNEEIEKHNNEMSLVMMFNKIQSPEDYTNFRKTSREYMESVLKNTPPELMKMNVPQEDAKEILKQMEAKHMGYLFENAEKMDIQAERRNTEEARKEADEARRQTEQVKAALRRSENKVLKAQKEAQQAQIDVQEAQNRAQQSEEKLQKANIKIKTMITNLISICKIDNLAKDETRKKLINQYQIDESDLNLYFEECWNRNHQ